MYPTACFTAGVELARPEGIVPAPEANHVVRAAIDEALHCKAEGAGTHADLDYDERELMMALAGLPSVRPPAAA